MFTCTGSEAGDLALRIAKHHTGGTGVIVTAQRVSRCDHRDRGDLAVPRRAVEPARWVRVVAPRTPTAWIPRPTGYADLGDWFAAAVHGRPTTSPRTASGSPRSCRLDPRLRRRPPRPGGVPRAGARRGRTGRAALYLADEVQPGFGRTGERCGASRATVVPDLVTMGKPMGNGHAGRRHRRAARGHRGVRPTTVRYFNTFGGNPVSIAAAQAVLDVVRDEQLQQNAAGVGARLRTMLGELASRHDVIGDVRGAGLFVGVELVRRRRLPGRGLALACQRAAARRVLTGTAGPHNNVLKVRPPLSFAQADADRLVTELDATLTNLARST